MGKRQAKAGPVKRVVKADAASGDPRQQGLGHAVAVAVVLDRTGARPQEIRP